MDPDMDVGNLSNAGAHCRFTGVNEAFYVPSGYETVFNAAGAENMNRAKAS